MVEGKYFERGQRSQGIERQSQCRVINDLDHAKMTVFYNARVLCLLMAYIPSSILVIHSNDIDL